MTQSKRFMIPLSLLGVLVLASCAHRGLPSESSKSSEESSSSSMEKDPFQTPTSVSKDGWKAELRTSTLREGTSFFDGTGLLLYTQSGNLVKSYPTCVLRSEDGKVYSGFDALPKGSYEFELSSNSMGKTILSGSILVLESVSVEGKEGQGYHTISKDDSLRYRVSNFDGHGALGSGKTGSIGSPKILVIPLTFTDTSFTASQVDLIDKSYFGESSETGWESLKSYYEKSSYGALSFAGKTVSPYEYPMSCKAVENAYLAGQLDTNAIVNKAVKEVFARDGIDPKEYDYDGDGYLDGVEVIYNTNRSMEGNNNLKNLWWCFTTTFQEDPNPESPVLNRYFWSLYSKIDTGYYDGLADAHTIIHETGHMLGLNDYYDYTSSSMPAGLVDMMDFNVGDHGAYSKYLLGWVTPKVIDGSAADFTLTLSSFTDTGDCILLRNTVDDPHNGTPYDEYLMLSYVTPTGVNLKDSEGYPEWKGYGNGGTYKKAGLQVSHIDERMVTLEGSPLGSDGSLSQNKTVASYTDTPSNVEEVTSDEAGNLTLSKSKTYTLSSNSKGYSQTVNILGKLAYSSLIRENTLIPANKTNAFFKGITSETLAYFGEQTNLFGLPEYGCGASRFGLAEYSSLFSSVTSFNDGSALNYVFSVTAQTDSSITLRFQKCF